MKNEQKKRGNEETGIYDSISWMNLYLIRVFDYEICDDVMRGGECFEWSN